MKPLLRHIILENSDSSLTIPDIVKGLTITEAVYWVSQAWEEVSPVTIQKSWKKLIPSSETNDSGSNDDSEVPSVDRLKGWLHTDSHHLMLVRKWGDTVAEKTVKSMRQSSLFSSLQLPSFHFSLTVHCYCTYNILYVCSFSTNLTIQSYGQIQSYGPLGPKAPG